ncbi:MAG: spore coat U domain-containing protein [Desulfobulbaceae bacterium]|nr:spore coat U domain-containing protein [Desulfobulbaceae bacterium]
MKLIKNVCVVILVLTGGFAFGGMGSGNTLYSITLVDSCSIDTTGVFTDSLARLPSGSIEVKCTTGINYRVAMDRGNENINSPSMKGEARVAYVYYDILLGDPSLSDSGLGDQELTCFDIDSSLCTNGIGMNKPMIYHISAESVLTPRDLSSAGTLKDMVTFTLGPLKQ